MDYPHPLVTMSAEGTLDYSKVYDVGIGVWDKVAIYYGYPVSPQAPTRPRRSRQFSRMDTRRISGTSNQDIDADPRVDTWSNGTDATAN